MQHEHMKRIHDVLVRLEPVAGCGVAFEADVVVVGNDVPAVGDVIEDVIGREGRLVFGRPEVGEQHAVVVVHGIPRLAITILVLAAIGLDRHVEAVALHVEQPAVVAATDAIVPRPCRSTTSCPGGNTGGTPDPAGRCRHGTGSGLRPECGPASGCRWHRPRRRTDASSGATSRRSAFLPRPRSGRHRRRAVPCHRPCLYQ